MPRACPWAATFRKKAGKAPTFIVWAVKDPDDANLDRIQIIKGWTKSGQIFEKIYDVAWSGNRKPDPATGKVPAVGNTVDIKNATYTNSIGAVELKKVWRDPEFDPSLHAFYYARVLQIPTPRWTTYDAKKLGVPPPSFARRHGSGARLDVSHLVCADGGGGAQGRKARRHGCRPEAEGGEALDDAQLTQLIVGKTLTCSQHGYRPAVQNFLREGRTTSDSQRRWEATAAG